MDSHLSEMRQLLRLKTDDDDVLRVGIWGMGGIGKTTIAMEVYDEIHSQFDHCYFLPNVKEGFGNQVRMQEQLLSGIFKTQVRIHTLNDGYKRMKRLSGKRVLVVLDDVDNSNQIKILLGPEPPFGGGSRIIVTTRDSQILSGFERYEVKLLSDRDALILFCQHAFKVNKPAEEYAHLSRRAVEYAQGLPLALTILGSFLHNRSVSEWGFVLEKLKKTPDLDIQKVLKTSFDGLDRTLKEIFLDIACFFRGKDKDYVTKVLDSCGFSPDIGLEVLVERALVTISDNKLEMHDLLQEMGREIESTKEPGEQSRFWSSADVERVLTGNKATEAVEGLMINLLLGSSNWELYIEAEAFVHMRKLRLVMFTGLDIDDHKGTIHVNGDLQRLSPDLRVLVWHACPLKSLSSNFHPKNLVDLDMSHSHVKRLWQGIKPLKKLRSINLSYCKYLDETPDLTEATELEKLDLQGCVRLSEVHPSISALEKLVILNLKNCYNLKSLPSSIHMKSLETLVLSYCENLKMFPEISEDMEALSILKLKYTAIKELPSSIERLRRLKYLSMSNCTSLVCLPDSICNLAGLTYLNLGRCSELHNLPENIGSLESLSELNLYRSGLEKLPASILRLKLERFCFGYCDQMVAPLSSWPSSIEDCCTVVVHLDFSDSNLSELSDAVAHFPSLKILKLSRTKLESLPLSMNRLVFLEWLELDRCERLKSIPELSSSISYINADDCTALETVSTPKRPYYMGRCLTFSNCSHLVQNDIFRDIVKTHFPPQGNYSQPFYMCFPGSGIPEQFIHQCRGSSVTAQLPPNWFNNKFLGFAICAVTNKLSIRCFCTFKGDHCEYRFSFYLFHTKHVRRLESNHMFLGYVPWSEFGINGEEVNERCYTEAKFEIEHSIHWSESFGSCIERCGSCIKRCGVQFFFANSEEVTHHDFGEPMVHSEEGCSAEPSGSAIRSDTSDVDEQYLKFSELFGEANINSTESDYETAKIEDNDSSGKREILSRWTQQVRVASGLMQGDLNDGFSWKNTAVLAGSSYQYDCRGGPSCLVQSLLRTSIDDPTIVDITYIGKHTCWETLPMLTHQVRATPGRELEGPFDGFSWGKYGQMDLPRDKYPRVYYVCTPQNVQGCMAIKEVQRSNDDPTILNITYRGRHTCIQAFTISIGGRGDGRISEGGGALSTHDQVVQSPRSLGDDDSGENVTSLADRAMDNNVNMSPDATSQDMDVNDMANKVVAGYPNHGGVVCESISDAVVNQLEEEDPMDFEEALDVNSLKKRKRDMDSDDDQPNESHSISNNNP